MKIEQHHLDAVKKAIQPFDTPERRARYLAGDFPRSENVRDLDMRYRWDLVYAAQLNVKPLYVYLNDDHIDTALRKIVPPLRTGGDPGMH